MKAFSVQNSDTSRRLMREPERSILFILLTGCATPLLAQQPDAIAPEETPAGVQTEIEFVAGTGIATNPFNEANGSSTAAFATVEARPTVRLKSETGDVELQGLVQLRQYSKRYGLEDNYGASFRAVTRRSDRLTLRGNGRFSYSESGLTGADAGGLLSPGTPSTPTTPIVPDIAAPLDDIALIGQRSRIAALDAAVGADYRLTDRSFLTADISGRAMNFDLDRFGDYYFFTEELGFSHNITDRTAIGVVGQLSQIDYKNTRVGDANSYNALVSLDHKFDSRWAATVAVGMAFTSAKRLQSQPDLKFETIAYRGRICRNEEAGSLCLYTQRSPQPSANGSVRTAESYSLAYSQRISPRDRLSFSGNYARTSASRLGGVNAGPVKFYGGSARYENDLRSNMTAYAGLNYGKIDQVATSRKANYGAMIGLRFKIGASR